MRKPTPRPTDVELAILRAVWELGPATVRQVYLHLASREGQSYPAVLRMMQLMLDKGQLLRDEESRPHVYRPAQAKEQIQNSLVEDLLDRVFGGGTLDLLAATLSRRRMSDEEHREALRLVRQAREEKP